MNFEKRFLIAVVIVWLLSLILAFYPTPGTEQTPVAVNLFAATLFSALCVAAYFVAKKLIALSRRVVARVTN